MEQHFLNKHLNSAPAKTISEEFKVLPLREVMFSKPFQPTPVFPPTFPSTPSPAVVGTAAPAFLHEAVTTMEARAKMRDAGQGERSMAKTVAIFNAWTGNELSVQDGWRFMIALKQAREIQGSFNSDDYVDLTAYGALLGEEESNNASRRK